MSAKPCDRSAGSGINRREPIPGYILREKLGEGGYGEVWKAEAPGGLMKAVKIVFGHLSEARAARELKALERIKQVHHPMLLSLERIEVLGDHLVVVTELAEMSLRDRFNMYVRDGRCGIPRDELLGYLRDAADGLDYLFSQHSLQHLDVKPENLLLVGGRMKVADFGLIKDLHDRSVSIIGGLTPVYAPPELFDGRPNQHSDQYSLAIVYQEMLTGTLPFDGRTPAQIAMQHMQGSPCLSPLPRLDQTVIARALSKSPEQRFASCRALVDQLADSSKSRGRRLNATSGLETAEEDVPGRDTVCVHQATTRTGPVPMARPSQIQLLPPWTDNSSDRFLRPTLIIGVGGTGTQVVLQMKEKLADRFQSPQRLPCLRLLAVDTDAQQLHAEVTEGPMNWSPGERVLLRLRSGAEYRERRGTLLEWLSRRWLYNVPRSLKTQGIRPLGRLAMVDQFSEFQRALTDALSTMLDSDSVTLSAQTFGAPVAVDEPRVYLVGNTAGGTAGGAIFDLAYAVRTELSRRNLPDHGVKLFLLHSSPRRSGARDLAIANSIVTLKEFLDLASPEGCYPGEPTCGIPAFEHGRSAFRDTCFLHLGDELDDADYENRVAQVADYLTREVCAKCHESLHAMRFVEHEPVEFPTMQTIGMGSRIASLGDLPRAVADELFRRVAHYWVAASSQAEAQDLPLHEIDKLIRSPQPAFSDDNPSFDTDWGQITGLDIEQLLLQQAHESVKILQSPAEEYWTNLIQRLGNPHVHASTFPLLDTTIRRIVGRPDACSERDQHIPLRHSLEQSGLQLGRTMAQGMLEQFQLTLNCPGPRVFAALSRLNDGRRWLTKVIEGLDLRMVKLDQELGQLTTLLNTRESASRSQRAGASAEGIQSIWLRYALGQQHWAEVNGAKAAIKGFLSSLEWQIGQLVEMTRRIRALQPQRENRWTQALDQERIDVSFSEWIESQFPRWMTIIDQLVDSRLAHFGFKFSALMAADVAAWSCLENCLRELSFKVVSAALVQRSLDQNPNQGSTNGKDLLSVLIQQVTPHLASCGGYQRWSVLFGNESEQVQRLMRDTVTAATGGPPTELIDRGGPAMICCQMQQVPAENIIRHLIGSRRDLIQVAERLHTRIDVEWSPIL